MGFLNTIINGAIVTAIIIVSTIMMLLLYVISAGGGGSIGMIALFVIIPVMIYVSGLAMPYICKWMS